MYTSLVAYGPSQARSLVSILDIGRVDLYRILRGLRKRGLVEIILSSPSRYEAVVPKRAIEILIKESENRLLDLRRHAPPLVESLQSMSEIEKASEPRDDSTQDHFRLKYGRQVLDTREQLIENSRKEILIIWSAIGLKSHSVEGLLQHFERAAMRGVNIRAITEITREDVMEVQTIKQFTSLRISDNLSVSLRPMIIDSKQVLLSGTYLPASNEKELIALWTDNPAIVNGFILHFARLWESSAPIGDYIPQTSS